jgi:hypothetical protein
MDASNGLLFIGLIGMSLTACSGQVDIARNADSGGPAQTSQVGSGTSGGGTGNAGSGASSGSSSSGATPSEPDAGTITEPADAADWDGWSGSFASGSTGAPPSCSEAALACGVAFPGETPFATSQDAANALVGQWSFCGQTDPGFYGADQLGEEYAADGTYYQLIMGSGGQLVRNLDPQTISTWQIDLTPQGGVEIHTSGGGVQRSGGLSACPPSLVLLSVEARL